jgi:MFS family permease
MMQNGKTDLGRSVQYTPALRFVLLLGIVSLFADMTYEAARSITGPFLSVLGGSAATVGFTAGLGELFGYGLRFFSGLLSDKTKKYWLITIVGYIVNLIAVPLLALANHWELAAVLIVTERIGKAIRNPARDAMMSYAAKTVGTGWALAVHEALDRVGAIAGPFIVMFAWAIKVSSHFAFGVFPIPAILAIMVLVIARLTYPHPKKLETAENVIKRDKFPSAFWIYLAAVALVAAGFADFPLIAYHIKSHNFLADKWIPLLYACAMAIDGASALVFGRLYDKKGLLSLMAAIAISSVFALFAFSFQPALIIAGILLWGIGMGAQESIIRSVVADMVPTERRGTGFGLFNTGYGLAWFLGSALMGILYGFSLTSLIIFSILSQACSIPVLFYIHKKFPDLAKV